MSPFITHMAAEAHAADLREEARGTKPLRARHAQPGAARNTVARWLFHLAIALDHRLQRVAVSPSASGGGM